MGEALGAGVLTLLVVPFDVFNRVGNYELVAKSYALLLCLHSRGVRHGLEGKTCIVQSCMRSIH